MPRPERCNQVLPHSLSPAHHSENVQTFRRLLAIRRKSAHSSHYHLAVGWDLNRMCCAGASGAATDAAEQSADVPSPQATDLPPNPVTRNQPQVTLPSAAPVCGTRPPDPFGLSARGPVLRRFAWLTRCLCVGLQGPPALNPPDPNPTLLNPGQIGVDRNAANPPAQSTAAQKTQVGAPLSPDAALALLTHLTHIFGLFQDVGDQTIGRNQSSALELGPKDRSGGKLARIALRSPLQPALCPPHLPHCPTTNSRHG